MTTNVTVDVAVLTMRAGRLSLLLVERDEEPFAGRWTLPGGFVEDAEPLDTAAQRELCEETGVEGRGHLEQLATYGDPGRDPRGRVVSVAYLALMPDVPEPTRGRFWAVDELPELAFDHGAIATGAVERARAKLEYTTLATSFLEDRFTLGDLRRIYEEVWAMPLSPSAFRRQVLSTPGFVTPAGDDVFRRGPATVLHPAFLRSRAGSAADADL